MHARQLLLLLLLSFCGTAVPLHSQGARVHASATVVAPVQATVDPQVRVVRAADGQVLVEVGVQMRGAASWLVTEDRTAPGAPAGATPACGGWTGDAPAPAAPAGGREARRLTARVRCGAPRGGAVHPQPLAVRVAAIN